MTTTNPDQMAGSGDLTVHVVTGDPLLTRSLDLYRQGLAEAGVAGAEAATPPPVRPLGRTSFHVASDASGNPVGVIHATVGTLDQLSLGALMDPDKRLDDVICECPSIAVVPGAPDGTTELLYRSVYVFACRHGAQSLTAAVDPLTLNVFRDEYGIMFRALGPVDTHLGFDSVAVGENISVLENALRHLRRDFFDFLIEPFTANERARFGLDTDESSPS